ncbi:MAG: hypothetical protein BWY65_02402 [Firmicutes bacterium ADurb.Bin373]|nr:MAG: hypothetical protein BWY65_02402 [Firmicutes bacterium ADurb.Bin373]
MMNHTGGAALIKLNINSPKVVNPIPTEATILGSTRSERVPAKGDSKAMSTGWERRMSPAVCESKFIMTWRYKESKKPTAKVAL